MNRTNVGVYGCVGSILVLILEKCNNTSLLLVLST